MENEPNKFAYLVLGAFLILIIAAPLFIFVLRNKQTSQFDIGNVITELFGDNENSLDTSEHELQEQQVEHPDKEYQLDVIQNGAGEQYVDKICQIRFKYPENWKTTGTVLPLPQKPLSQVVFNEPAKPGSAAKNSILSFICYDAKKYSFDQFIGQSSLFQGQTEVITIGSIKWQRLGNFIYTVKNDKLYIFQMFFTKYDIHPDPHYEQIFLQILQAVQFVG